MEKSPMDLPAKLQRCKRAVVAILDASSSIRRAQAESFAGLTRAKRVVKDLLEAQTNLVATKSSLQSLLSSLASHGVALEEAIAHRRRASHARKNRKTPHRSKVVAAGVSRVPHLHRRKPKVGLRPGVPRLKTKPSRKDLRSYGKWKLSYLSERP